MKIFLKNLGTVNKNEIILETGEAQLIIYFSYQTPVGFVFRRVGKLVIEMTRENNWGPTTGKLLNDIEPDKKLRVNDIVFEKGLEKAIKQFLKGG